MVSSPVLFDDVSPSSSRSSSPVAPPLPVGEQLHPVRKLYDPATHCRVSPDGVFPPPRRVWFPSAPQSDAVPSSPLSADELSPDADVDIPSAQPRPDRHADVVDPTPAPEQRPPNDDDDESSDPLETSADLLLPNEDLVKLNGFRAKWFESFSAEHS